MKDEPPVRILVPEESAGLRLDKYLNETIPGMSRSRAQSLIAQELVRVNGAAEKSKYALKEGDEVVVTKWGGPERVLTPVKMTLDIIFEDDDLVVVNKPAGLVVHPGAGDTGPTLVEGLLYHCGALAAHGDEPMRPGIVHRLDKDTSGVMVCAKTPTSHARLSQQFAEKSNYRLYVTILDGFMRENEASVESYLGRDPQNRLRIKSWEREIDAPSGARWAKSHFRRIHVYKDRITVAEAQLETGRTHQIRVHARQIGIPVLGDSLYNNPSAYPKTFGREALEELATVNRQMLHAKYLGFVHPISNQKVAFEAEVPEDMRGLLRVLGCP